MPIRDYITKLFGQEDWPGLESAWASRQVNQPRDTSGVNARAMYPWEKLTGGSALNYPWGTIAVNRQFTEEDKNLEDTLVHELIHVKQRKQPLNIVNKFKSLMLPWDKRPEEIEAIAAERNYPGMDYQRDIQLRPQVPSKNRDWYSKVR